MLSIKDTLLISGCKIRTDEYIDGTHHLAKKIVAKESCQTKSPKLPIGFYAGYISFDSAEQTFEIYIDMDLETMKLAELCHKYPKSIIKFNSLGEANHLKLNIGDIDLYRRCFREWVEHLYTIGAINKEQADYLLGPYTYRLNTKDTEVFNHLFKYIDIEKAESYDNSNTKLDF